MTFVGNYSNGIGNTHGFVQILGQAPQALSYPGQTATFATGVNDSGTVVGYYVPFKIDQNSRGFVLSGGSYVEYVVPGAVQTYVNAVNDSGQLAGTWTDTANGYHGFIATPLAGLQGEQ